MYNDLIKGIVFFRTAIHVTINPKSYHLIMVRELEELETYHDQDIGNSQLYDKDSFTAEQFGYGLVLTTFIVIVVLVCIVGIAITAPCSCCRGSRVNLLSINYYHPTKVSSYHNVESGHKKHDISNLSPQLLSADSDLMC